MDTIKQIDRYSREDIEEIYNLPFMDLMFRAQQVHREHHNPNEIQWSTLLSIKTGSCPEDCKYCSQSAHYNTELEKEPLIDVDEVLKEAYIAKENGSTRFCMGAAWRRVPEKDMPKVTEMIREVKSLGMETCVTLGTINQDQAKAFKDAGLDYYNHNLDTSREHYENVISTRTYDERLSTLKNVQDAGINVCCGGILGLGEEKQDRIGLLFELANMEQQPESVPINQLVSIEGTPMAEDGVEEVDSFEFVRTIATARILMPRSYVRLSAGRETMTDELQTLCFMAGANSVFTGDKLLTTDNKAFTSDRALLETLGMSVQELNESACSVDA